MYAVVLTEDNEFGRNDKLVVLYNASNRPDQRALFDTFGEAWACLQTFRKLHPSGKYAIMDPEDVCEVVKTFVPFTYEEDYDDSYYDNDYGDDGF